MNRALVFGIAIFFAIVGIALMGSDNKVLAGHRCDGGCHACDGGCDGGCHACDGGGCHQRRHRHHRRRRCHGCDGGGCHAGYGCNGGGCHGGCGGGYGPVMDGGAMGIEPAPPAPPAPAPAPPAA